MWFCAYRGDCAACYLLNALGDELIPCVWGLMYPLDASLI